MTTLPGLCEYVLDDHPCPRPGVVTVLTSPGFSERTVTVGTFCSLHAGLFRKPWNTLTPTTTEQETEHA